MRAKIIGTGRFLPEYRMSNFEFSELVETSDEWITSRTGIKERRIAKKESTADMAAGACVRALENASVKPEEVDMIIAATSTPDLFFPNCASIVQKKIGASRAACFDLSAACSGFIAGLMTAAAYIEAGLYGNVLVVGSEKMSNLVDWKDRSTCILFGDGAGACVVGRRDPKDLSEIISGDFHTDGDEDKVLTAETSGFIHMNGQAVFRFAVKRVPETIKAMLDREGFQPDEVKYYLLHQANIRIIESAAKRIELSGAGSAGETDAKNDIQNKDIKEIMKKFPSNLERYGNTSSASIPILLDELNRENKLHSGDLLCLAGFGAGLSWGGALVRW